MVPGSPVAVLLALRLLAAAPCRIDQADRALTCEERRWAGRGLQSPCRLNASQLEAAFGLAPPAAAAVFTAMNSCGLKSERAWVAAATAAPGHVLPAWGVVSFLDAERQGVALKKVLALAPDPIELAFKLNAFGRLDDEAERFLKAQGPQALAALAQKGILSLDDAERAYASAIKAELPAESLGPLLGLVAVKRLFSERERPGLARFLDAQPPVAREGLLKALATVPWGAPQFRHDSGLDDGLEIVRALLGEAPTDGGWLLYIALAHRKAEAFPLVADKVSPAYARRLAGQLDTYSRELTTRRDTDEAWRRQELAKLQERVALFAARGIVPPASSAAPAEVPDPARAVISSALENPQPLPWRERAGRGAARALRAASLPAGYRAVTPLASSVVVATSQRVDPTGEASAGGYWLFVREKEGPWNAPLYTGLRVMRPFEVEAVGLAGQAVRLVVRSRPIDERTVTFPPVGLRTTGTGARTTLESSLEELSRDEDGDGLTDVLEGRLFTNPKAADTDGDGMRDDVDPLPLVAAPKGPPSLRAQALGAALGFIDGDSPEPAMVAPDAVSALSLGPPNPGAPAGPRITFVVGNRSEFVGVTAASRILVLTEAEHAAAIERLGAYYPRRVDVEFSEDGQAAWVRWSDRWRGGELLGRVVDGRWVLRSISAWVT